uniref:Uncharacterized protein n=1 Tax=Anguilla anguilla TaxID=7936 RepID=A0A0E9WR14_ANGAN
MMDTKSDTVHGQYCPTGNCQEAWIKIVLFLFFHILTLRPQSLSRTHTHTHTHTLIFKQLYKNLY